MVAAGGDMSENITGPGVFLGCVIGAAIMAAGYGISTDTELWLKNAGLAEIVISAGTLVAVTLGGIAALRTLDASAKADRAGRSLKGAELIANGGASRVLGMHVLRGIAKEDPGTYLVPVLHTLSSTIFQANSTAKETMAFHIRPRRPYTGIWLEAESVVADALSIIGDLCPEGGQWPNSPDIAAEGRFHITGAYIAGFRFHGERLPNCMFNRVVLHSTHFVGADFKNSQFIGTIGHEVVFEGCDLRGTQFLLDLPDGSAAPPHPHFAEFRHCKMDEGTSWGGMPLGR